jgi:hypothetical protein
MLGFHLVFVWFSFGLVLALLVLVYWYPVGSLVVRSCGPVLNSVDDVIDVICVVCLVCWLGLLGYFGQLVLPRVRWAEIPVKPIYMGVVCCR